MGSRPQASPGAAGGGEVFQRGAVVRVTLENFLTYDNVTVRPGARLNLIIGPNGTGKSTLVAALVLGLAGKPDVLGRASRIEYFIKEGAREAKIELELYDEAGNHVVTRHVEGNRSRWRYNGETVAEERVKLLVASLNIQVDNLCQILPQEKVQDFASLDAAGLLEGTEKAVGYRGMFEDHQRLKNEGTNQAQLKLKIEEAEGMIQKCDETIASLQNVVDNQVAREKFENDVKKLKQRLKWLEYDSAQAEFVRLRDEKKAALQHLQKAEENLAPLRRQVDATKREVDGFDFERKLKAATTELPKLNMLRERAGEAELEVTRLETEHKKRREEEEQRRRSEEGLRQKLGYLEKELAELEQVGPELEEEIHAAGAAIRNLSARESALQQQQEASSREREELQGRVNGLQSELRRVRSVGDRRLEMLRSKNRHVYDAVLWLRQNRDRFQSAVHEPMILLLDVVDPRLAKYVQASVPWRDLLAFTCESRDDMNAFLRETRDRQKLSVSCVLSDPSVRLDSFKPTRSAQELREMGFTHTVAGLLGPGTPEALRRYLYKTYRLYDIPVADVEGQAARHVLERTKGQQKLNNFLVGNQSYRSGRSRYTGNEWIQSTSIAAADQMFTMATDKQREGELLTNIAEANDQLEVIGRKEAETQAACDELAAKLEAERRRRKDLTARRDARRTLESRQRSAVQSLRNCVAQAVDLETVAAETSERVEAALRRFGELQTELLAACGRYRQLAARVELARTQRELAERRGAVAGRALEEAAAAVEGLRTAAVAAERAAKDQKERTRRLRQEAVRAVGLRDDDSLPHKLKQLFRALSDSPDVIEAQISEAEARAEQLGADDEDAVKRYKAAHEERARLQDLVQQRHEDLRRQLAGSEEKLQRWLTALENIVAEASGHFSRFFAEMDCAGDVELLRPADGCAARYGIVIRVKFRAAEKLQELSRTHHSGGERSVATMLYIMALQHLESTTVPFHCVDEINQGMDAQNERRVFDLVVRAACRRRGAQYFLVTPKLLPKLHYPEQGLTVLVVFNSPTMMPHTEWDVEKFCRLKRERRSRVAAEAVASVR